MAAMTRRLLAEGLGIAVLIGLVAYPGVTACLADSVATGSATGEHASNDKGSATGAAGHTGANREKPAGPANIALPPVAETPLTSAMQVTSVKDAQRVLDQAGATLALGDGSRLEIEGHTTDARGRDYFQVQQKYEGINVYGAASVLEVQDGAVELLYGTTVPGLEVDTSPSYEAVEALQIALANAGVPAERGIETLGEQPGLIILVTDEGSLLCWVIAAYLTNPQRAPEIFTVDAHQPEILLRSQMLQQ